MKCPSCGNPNAECVIGNYWSCPGTGCSNTSKASPASPSSKGAFYRMRELEWEPRIWVNSVLASPASTCYTGSPWQPGQHKVAVGCGVRPVGSEFEYAQGSALYDTWVDRLIHNPGDTRCQPGSGFADYEVELVSPAGKVWGAPMWRVRVVRELP